MNEMQIHEKKFWSDRRVLITGHSGFKGGWLTLWLNSLGATIKGISLPPNDLTCLFECAHIAEGIESIFCDIRNYKALSQHIDDFKPDVVFHMAAQPLVRYSYSNPLDTYSTNVMGTVNLLEACRHCPSVKAIVNITTDKCYQNNEWVWGYRENDPMGGHDPYSNSKGCAELVTSAFRDSYFSEPGQLGLASVRAGNVIGGGDSAQDRLIPDIVRSIEGGKLLEIRNPYAVRPWQHVLEPLSGYMMLAEKLYYDSEAWAGAWNFGPEDDDSKPVVWIVEKMLEKWGGGAGCTYSASAVHEAHTLRLDISKSKQILKWRPVWNLEQAIDKIVDWHKSKIADQNMRGVCLAQIEEFESTKGSVLKNEQ